MIIPTSCTRNPPPWMVRKLGSTSQSTEPNVKLTKWNSLQGEGTRRWKRRAYNGFFFFRVVGKKPSSNFFVSSFVDSRFTRERSSNEFGKKRGNFYSEPRPVCFVTFHKMMMRREILFFQVGGKKGMGETCLVIKKREKNKEGRVIDTRTHTHDPLNKLQIHVIIIWFGIIEKDKSKIY